MSKGVAVFRIHRASLAVRVSAGATASFVWAASLLVTPAGGQPLPVPLGGPPVLACGVERSEPGREAGATCRSAPSPTLVRWWWQQEPEDLGPKVFNASVEAHGGDIISLQGAGFDEATVVTLVGAGDSISDLPIVSRVGEVQLSVQLPKLLADPVVVRVRNSHGMSAPLKLNAARPLHLDATRLVPGGRFRVFGRNLMRDGHQPVVTVDGRPAGIDEKASSAMVLVATLPADAKPAKQAVILVDNGNGTGPVQVGTRATVEAVAGADILKLGVGWGAAFDFTTRVIRAAAACDASTDDTAAVRTAVQQAAGAGGGVVLLPEGTCRIAKTIDLASKVILRGAGQGRTILRYDGDYPIFAENFDLVGLQDLTLRNAGSVQEGLKWHNNTRSFIQRVKLDMQKSRQWFLTDNTDFVFQGNTITQTASFDQQNPYRFDRCSGLVFENNTSLNRDGSPTFQRVHDAVFVGNHFSRDASSQDESPVIAHHQFVVDFSYRISLLDNRFDVVNGPVTNTDRNDGETILVEGGGPLHTEHLGKVSKATANSLTDPSAVINTDPFETGLPPNMAVAIVAGKGMGQSRRISRYEKGTIEIDRDWDVIPDATSRYATFVWGLIDSLIANNVLVDNPRGIWLYQASVRNVVIADNTIKEGGGIYLRAFQNERQQQYSVLSDMLITGNTVESTTGRWMPHIILAYVSSDPAAIGTAMLGIAVRRNHIVANVPNLTSNSEEYASHEGFAALVHIENPRRESNEVPALLGIVFQGNACDHCEKAYATGTGTFGAVFADNTPPPSSGAGFADMLMMGECCGGSTATFKR